jgi:hypothetical protein
MKQNYFKMKILIAFLSVCVTSDLFAADGAVSSGGGNAVVCFNNVQTAQSVQNRKGIVLDNEKGSIVSIEALELFNLRQKRLSKIKRIPVEASSEDPWDYVQKIQDRFEVLAPQVTRQIAELKKQFNDDDIILSEKPLVRQFDANESQNLNVDGFCSLTTLLVQSGTNQGNAILTLDERLFFHEKHSFTSRGVMLLHELVYRRGLLLGDRTSGRAQETVQHLISDEPAMPLIEWIVKSNKIGLIKTDSYYSGVNAMLDAVMKEQSKSTDPILQRYTDEYINVRSPEAVALAGKIAKVLSRVSLDYNEYGNPSKKNVAVDCDEKWKTWLPFGMAEFDAGKKLHDPFYSSNFQYDRPATGNCKNVLHHLLIGQNFKNMEDAKRYPYAWTAHVSAANQELLAKYLVELQSIEDKNPQYLADLKESRLQEWPKVRAETLESIKKIMDKHFRGLISEADKKIILDKFAENLNQQNDRNEFILDNKDDRRSEYGFKVERSYGAEIEALQKNLYIGKSANSEVTEQQTSESSSGKVE